jgi:hypothetical protein
MALYTSALPNNIDPTPSAAPTITAATIGTTAVQILAANANRKGFVIQNTSNRTLYLGVTNAVTATTNFFTSIPANGLYEWTLQTVYTGALFAIANGAAGSAQVLELSP